MKIIGTYSINVVSVVVDRTKSVEENFDEAFLFVKRDDVHYVKLEINGINVIIDKETEFERIFKAFQKAKPGDIIGARDSKDIVSIVYSLQKK